MTARRPIRRSLRNSRRNCRKSCNGVPTKRARSWNSSRASRRRRHPSNEKKLVQRGRARPIAAAAVLDEDFGDLRMPHRLAAIVRQQILLGHIGDVFGLVVLGEQVIERLVLMRSDFRGDRLVPFVGIVEHRIELEHHAAERIEAVPDDLADLIFGVANLAHGSGQITACAASSCKAAIVANAGVPAVHRPFHNPYLAARYGSFAGTSRAKCDSTLACFQVASSCILPSIITAPEPSGMAAMIFLAKATSAGSGENTRWAIGTWLGCSVQAPTQPIRKALRNCASQAAASAKSPNGPWNGFLPAAGQASTIWALSEGQRSCWRAERGALAGAPGAASASTL